MKRSRRSFPTAAGWFFTRPSKTNGGSRHHSTRAPCLASFGQNGLPRAVSFLMLKRRERRQVYTNSVAGLSAGAYRVRGSSPNRFRVVASHNVKQPISFPRRVGARGFRLCFTHPEIEGWAERRETFGCVRGTRAACHNAARQALARRLASRNAGRSPLGAPPWRFFTRGRASFTGIAAGSVAASSSQPGAWRRGPGPPETSGYEPPPQDATPRSAFRIASGDAPR
jgi:hypothetical protein